MGLYLESPAKIGTVDGHASARGRRGPNPSQDQRKVMALIEPGKQAPDFKLDSHLDTTVSLSDFRGSKNVLLVSYPLDFTPT